MHWLYIHFPCLQLDSSLQPRDAQGPCVLIRQGRVVQNNQAARENGIAIGTGLAQAALLCHDLTIANYQLRQEQQLLKQLAHELYQLSATLYLYPPQGLLFKTQDMRRLYRDMAHYWHSLQQPLQRRHLSYFYAAAHTPLTAQILALAHKNQLCQSAQEATRLLDQLPIDEAGFSPVLNEQLQRLGLRLLGQVQALSRPKLGKKLGIELVQHLQHLYHEQPVALPAYRPQEYFSQQLPLLYEVEHSPGLRFPLSRLLQAMEAFLHSRQLQVARVKLGLIYREQDATWLQIGSAAGEYQAKLWLDLIMLRLEQLELNAPVIGLHLKGHQQGSREVVNQSLFDTTPTSQLNPGQLLGRLQNKLGNHCIQHLGLCDDYRPEHSTYNQQWQHLDNRQQTQKHPTSALRPSILLPLPRMLAGKPRYGWQQLQGPERIQSGWWDNQAICRDYFIMRNPQGQLCWLFRNHQEEWFIHGYFA